MTVSIGVDGAASNEACDMISETHAAWLMQRAKAGERALPRHAGGHFEGGAHVACVEDVVRWGSAGGAQVLGLGDVGTLQVGMSADLAIYRLDQPRYFGLHDLGIAPVVGGGRPTLHALLVGGRLSVENDQLPGVDLAQLRSQAREAVLSLQRAAGARA